MSSLPNHLPPAQVCLSEVAALKNPVFISDLHLTQDKPATVAAFLRFMERDAPRFRELVILGDFFEFWPGDDALNPQDSIVRALKAFACQTDKRLLMMHGNRDFLLGQAFSSWTGCELIADPIVVQVQTERILLSHGDIWCTLDKSYQDFRSTLRSPELQAQVLQEKLEYRIALANNLRDQSSSDNQNKTSDMMDVVIADVGRAVKHAMVRNVIHGHTHKPSHHTHVAENFRFDRWVLPDWDYEAKEPRGGYLSFENGFLHFGQIS